MMARRFGAFAKSLAASLVALVVLGFIGFRLQQVRPPFGGSFGVGDFAGFPWRGAIARYEAALRFWHTPEGRPAVRYLWAHGLEDFGFIAAYTWFARSARSRWLTVGSRPYGWITTAIVCVAALDAIETAFGLALNVTSFGDAPSHAVVVSERVLSGIKWSVGDIVIGGLAWAGIAARVHRRDTKRSVG